ncbi:MAG TPA: spermidine synthase [Thermoanaerobaculia bacterium]
MIPWTLLGSARIPGDGGEMRLLQRGGEYSIRVGSYELMNSRVHGSEDALASLVCERLDCARVRVLIGGLGMAFTLLAVLKSVGRESEVVVSELVPEVVAWHRGPLAAVSGGALDDPRVSVREVDVARVLRDERSAFDAVLLDVDNGPVGLTSRKNDWLYSPAGLRAAHAALRPGGILAVWSAGPDAAFTRRLQQAGFSTEEVRVRGRGGKGGPRYLIWIARRSDR